jgi:hypothetical protein
MIVPPKSRRRCRTCHAVVAVTGHAYGCPVGRCVRCRELDKAPGSRHCIWCAAEAERKRKERERRDQILGERLKMLGGGGVRLVRDDNHAGCVGVRDMTEYDGDPGHTMLISRFDAVAEGGSRRTAPRPRESCSATDGLVTDLVMDEG